MQIFKNSLIPSLRNLNNESVRVWLNKTASDANSRLFIQGNLGLHGESTIPQTDHQDRTNAEDYISLISSQTNVFPGPLSSPSLVPSPSTSTSSTLGLSQSLSSESDNASSANLGYKAVNAMFEQSNSTNLISTVLSSPERQIRTSLLPPTDFEAFADASPPSFEEGSFADIPTYEFKAIMSTTNAPSDVFSSVSPQDLLSSANEISASQQTTSSSYFSTERKIVNDLTQPRMKNEVSTLCSSTPSSYLDKTSSTFDPTDTRSQRPVRQLETGIVAIKDEPLCDNLSVNDTSTRMNICVTSFENFPPSLNPWKLETFSQNSDVIASSFSLVSPNGPSVSNKEIPLCNQNITYAELTPVTQQGMIAINIESWL